MAIFNRQPDPVGHAYWVELHSKGLSLTQIAHLLLTSTEGAATYQSLDGPSFIEHLYLNTFLRTPDTGGVAHWNTVPQQGTGRASITVSFSESTEFKHLTKTS